MIAIHWEEIVELLLDEMLEDEAILLTEKENVHKTTKKHTNLADKGMSGKFHDFKTVDTRDILKIFDEYKEAEKSILNRL